MAVWVVLPAATWTVCSRLPPPLLRQLPEAASMVSSMLPLPACLLPTMLSSVLPAACQVSRRVLEEVRAAKTVTAKLIGRVSRIKKEIEDVLEDDADMQASVVGRGSHADINLAHIAGKVPTTGAW